MTRVGVSARAICILALALFGCGGASQSPGAETPASAAGAETAATAPSSGPLGDPVALWPDIYRVLLENEYVRVLEVRMEPGEHDDWHGHPPSAGYVLTAGKVRAYASDGTFKDSEVRPGLAAAHPAIAQHKLENIGSTDVHILFAERKGDPPRQAQAYLDAPSVEPEVYRVVAESDWFRVLEIHAQPAVEGAPHSHQASVVYALEEAHVSHTTPGEGAVEQTLPAGKAVYVPAVAEHTARNLGTAEMRVVMFEIK